MPPMPQRPQPRRAAGPESPLGNAIQPPRQQPLYETVREWTERYLEGPVYSRPARKRVAVLVAGLIAGEQATVSHWAGTVAGLAISGAQEESIVRRLQRIVDDARLDPERLLPTLFRAWLPELLAGVIAAHAANEGSGPGHHRRFRPLHLVLDESSKTDQVHLLVVGLAYQGLVLPLGVRCWPQNTPLPEGEYWTQVSRLLCEVQTVLPPVLRDHVVLLADRGFGHPRLIDLLGVLGWAYVLRTQDQVRLQLPDGTTTPLRSLVTRPGQVWLGGSTTDGAATTAPVAPVAVFKAAGWRTCQVVALWAAGQAAPWLLLTDLPARATRWRDYARRWAIERLFLAWKSHGWDLEASGLRTPAQVGRLVSGLVLATWWRIALALPVCLSHLAALSARAAHRLPPPDTPLQLPLPGLPGLPGLSPSADDLAPPGAAPPPARPWAAKFSLFTWGIKVIRATACRSETPALCWTFPFWQAPVWSAHCARVASPAA